MQQSFVSYGTVYKRCGQMRGWGIAQMLDIRILLNFEVFIEFGIFSIIPVEIWWEIYEELIGSVQADKTLNFVILVD